MTERAPLMTSRDVGRPITVGVADKQHAALAFAAEEARLSDCDIRVVHSYIVPPSPPQVMGTAYGFDIDGSFRDSGREVLSDATDFLAQQDSELVVHPVLLQGPAPMILVGSSSTSRLLVLGPDDAVPWYSRLSQSRVARRLSEEAGCPVVVVPDTWDAGRTPRGVTLLLDSQTVAHGPLRFAFEQASRHHDALSIVHVQAADGSHGEAVLWQDMLRLIESWRATYPQVWVTTTVISGTADLPTVAGLERTGMLVLGRSHTHGIASMRESLAQAVIEHASCAVAVVPADYDA